MATLGPAPDPVNVLRGHRSPVTCLAFHPLSGYLLSGDAQGELKIWDVVRQRQISSSRVHTYTSGVIGIGTARHLENRFLSQSRDGTVKCWQLSDGGLSRDPLLSFNTESYHFCKLSIPELKTEEVDTERTDAEEGRRLEVAPQGLSDISRIQKLLISNSIRDPESSSAGGGRTLVALVGEDPSVVEIWDVDGGTRVGQLRQSKNQNDTASQNGGGSAAGMCMALHAFQKEAGGHLEVLSGYENGSMALWDLRFSNLPRINEKIHSEPVLSIKLDSTCEAGVSGSADNKLVMFSLAHNENSFRVKSEITLSQPGIADISVRNDNKIFATAGWDHRVRIFDYRKRRPLAVLNYHAAGVTGVAFSEDRKMLVTSSDDSTIALWSIYPPPELLKLTDKFQSALAVRDELGDHHQVFKTRQVQD